MPFVKLVYRRIITLKVLMLCRITAQVSSVMFISMLFLHQTAADIVEEHHINFTYWDVTYLLGPEAELFTDKLQQLQVTEWQEVYNFIDPTEKLVPPEMSLRRIQSVTTQSYSNCSTAN